VAAPERLHRRGRVVQAGGQRYLFVARRAPLYRCLMFSSWRGWRLSVVAALVLGAGAWSVLIGRRTADAQVIVSMRSHP
jgi:hypothetical protein